MGWVEVKRALVTALRTGNFEHEVRDVQAEKNLLAIGDVTPEVVLQLIQQTTGREHSTCPHHWGPFDHSPPYETCNEHRTLVHKGVFHRG